MIAAPANWAAAQRLIIHSIDAKVEVAHLHLNEFAHATNKGSLHKSSLRDLAHPADLVSVQVEIRLAIYEKLNAKLIAFRAKLKFVEKEVEILQEKAALDARHKLERAKCEIEIQERKAEMMKENFDIESRHSEILQISAWVQKTM